MKDLLTYEEAKTLCRKEFRGDLLSVDFREKQAFLERYMKANRIVNNVWIGLEPQKDGTYKWSDGTTFNFNNWGAYSPSNNSKYCVQMQTNVGSGYGKWSDVPCNKRNSVVCERNQIMDPERVQTMVFDLKKNPFPVGFIYTQLPNEKSPLKIWPWMTWKEIKLTGSDGKPSYVFMRFWKRTE